MKSWHVGLSFLLLVVIRLNEPNVVLVFQTNQADAPSVLQQLYQSVSASALLLALSFQPWLLHLAAFQEEFLLREAPATGILYGLILVNL